MKKFLWFALVIIISTGFIAGCKKKDKGTPPELPPVESMIIDFSNFMPETKSAASFNKGVNNSTWEFASLYAGYWNTLLKTTLAVPMAAFAQAKQSSPAFLAENLWQWSYNTNVTLNSISSTYKTRLTGQKTATEILWKMYISKEGTGAFTEFLWFEGTSEINGTAGQWMLNHSYQHQDRVLQIDWTKNNNTVNSVKYSYIRDKNDSGQTDPLKGSYIESGRTTDPLNSFYSIHYFNGISFLDLRIEWNSTSNEGRVRSLSYFGNNNWYCWNSNYQNIVCP
ncbi:MAG: hypothetical protein ACM3RX_04650 [Methanococcaceae archaeon]